MSVVSRSHPKKIVILGGGLSGLTYLHYLRTFVDFHGKSNALDRVVLVEANDYLGGSIKTKTFEDGVTHELGRKCIKTSGNRAKATMAMVEHLRLGKDVALSSEIYTRNRQVFTKDNKLESFPKPGFSIIFKRLPGLRRRVASILYQDHNTPKIDLTKFPYGDPTIYQFAEYRLGQDVAENFVDPIVRANFGGDCRRLGCKSTIGDILEKEQVYGSLMKAISKPPLRKLESDKLLQSDIKNSELRKAFDQIGRNGVYTFRQGLQQLPDRLANSLINANSDNKVHIYNQTKAISIDSDDSSESSYHVIVETIDGHRVRIDADHIVSAIPSFELVKLLHNFLPSNGYSIWDEIGKIPYNSYGSICLEFRNSKLRQMKNLQIPGISIHSKSDSLVSQIFMDSANFDTKEAPEIFKISATIDRSVLESVGGLDWKESAHSLMEDIAIKEVKRLLQIKYEPHRVSSHLWTAGIAQYLPGHKEHVDKIRSEIIKNKLPLTLIGQSYDGISINDLIYNSRIQANELAKNYL